jgi:hypothetical protein
MVLSEAAGWAQARLRVASGMADEPPIASIDIESSHFRLLLELKESQAT